MPAPETVDAYLAALPDDRRAALQSVRQTILDHLPNGYEEGIQYGIIGYFVPHSLYPAGYHCDPKQPLPFAQLASQKRHMALYLFCIYMDEALKNWFADAWRATGKRLDMGAGCVRFRTLDDVPLDLVGKAIARMPVEDFIARYDATRPKPKTKKKAARP